MKHLNITDSQTPDVNVYEHIRIGLDDEMMELCTVGCHTDDGGIWKSE